MAEVSFHVASTQNTICRGEKSNHRRHNQTVRKRAVNGRERRRTGGRQGSKKKFRKKSHSTENESFSPLPIFIHGTESCVILLFRAELYPILLHWNKVHPILKHWVELYPILIHCQSISSHCIKSKQYPQTWKLTAGVNISPRRNNYPRGQPGKSSESFFKKSLTVPKSIATKPKNSHSISFYIETNYSPCLYLTECYFLSYYMHPLS